jgi:hypothetical protein
MFPEGKRIGVQSGMPWWIRLVLFFKKPTCGVDWGYKDDKTAVVCIKKFRGVYYIYDYKEYNPDEHNNEPE